MRSIGLDLMNVERPNRAFTTGVLSDFSGAPQGPGSALAGSRSSGNHAGTLFRIVINGHNVRNRKSAARGGAASSALESHSGMTSTCPMLIRLGLLSPLAAMSAWVVTPNRAAMLERESPACAT